MKYHSIPRKNKQPQKFSIPPDFKGLWIPQDLIDIVGPRLAMDLCAFHIRVGGLIHTQAQEAIELGAAEQHEITPKEAEYILKNKQPQNIRLNYDHFSCIEYCDWCSCSTVITHRHHHPLTKKQGGKETVNLCPNCHYEYHELIGHSFFRLKKQFTKQIEAYSKHGVQNNDAM